MLISREKLAGTHISLNTRFMNAIKEYTPIYKQLVTELPSSAAIETYNWMGLVPKMEKWVGERVIHKLRAEKYTIENFDWANGIEVTRDDLAEDKLGLVAMRIADLAKKGLDAIDDEVARILNNAFAAAGGLAYDGQFLIDSDHLAKGDGTGTAQSNTGGTTALSDTALLAGYEAGLAMKDEAGDPMGIQYTHLVVGPALWSRARALVDLPNLAGGAGAPNPTYGLVKLILHPKLTSKKWFLIDMNQGIAPIIVQVRRQPQFRDPNLGMNSMEFFFRKDLYYGADLTFGVGLGLWQAIYGSNATT
jgi:phage major head subunit gpT-like protein